MKKSQTTYRQKLRDPRWQKVRLKIFERDSWKCQCADCQSPEFTPLAVHHKSYKRAMEPWDYPLSDLVTLCEICHNLVHAIKTAKPLIEGNIYSWSEIAQLLGFVPDKYLTEKNDTIVCACIRRDYNPDAPAILLPGDTDEIVEKSLKFASQEHFIPFFIKGREDGWEYHGRYRVETATSNSKEISIQQRHAKLEKIPISMVLFLEKETLRA